MAGLRILVAEGNERTTRELHRKAYGATPGERYAEEIRALRPGTRVDIVCPSDGGASPAPGGYHGVAVTGSALNAYNDVPEVRRQVEFARYVFETGLPFFGSCWGLQIAAIAAGGAVERNPAGREVAYAREIYLTGEGTRHPMHRGRPPAFSAPAIHGDHIVHLPGSATVTASNAVSAIQAAEIFHAGGVFWGTQYHPEFSLEDIANVIFRYGQVLVEEGNFSSLDELEAYAGDILRLARDPGQTSIAWRYGISRDVMERSARMTEIANWLDFCEKGRQAGSRLNE